MLRIPGKTVLIGASTGGPGHIEKIVESLPKLHDTSVVIAQHMALDFMPSFTKRLQRHTANNIMMVSDGTVLVPGDIYICHGVTSLKKEGDTVRFGVKLSQENRYNPDINAVFSSFAPFSSNTDILAVILTGIGDDGVKGCAQLAALGARTMTQNELSAIVDGMPSRARKEVAGIETADTDRIIDAIREFCN